MSSFDIVINMLESSVSVFVLLIFFQSKKRYRNIICFLLFSLTFITQSISNLLVQYDYLLIYIHTIIFFISIFYYSDATLTYKLCIVFIPSFLLDTCNIIAMSLTSLMFSINMQELVNSTTILKLAIIFSKIILFLTIYFVYYLSKKSPDIQSSITKEWWPLVALSFSISLISDILFSYLFNEAISPFDLLLLLCALNIMIIMTFKIFFIIYVLYKQKVAYNCELLTLKHREESFAHQKEYIKELHILQHDAKHLYGHLSYLLKNKDYIGLNKILDEKLNYINDKYISKYSDNPIFNSILNNKAEKMKKEGIDFKTKIQLPNILNIEDSDIYVLLGNIIDNAIENCNGEKIIMVDASLKEDYLKITVKNSIEQSVLKDNENLKTTKKDFSRHGYGISSMETIVSRYLGSIQFLEENNFFICEVICYN